MSAEIHIRWMILRDMPEVLAIEAQSFDVPWNESEFIRNLRCRDQIGMVAEIKGRVVGFMIYRLDKKALTLLNMAVHPQFRRRGVGASLLDKLAGKLSTKRRERIEISVIDSNLPCHLFLRSLGYEAVEVLRDYEYDEGHVQDAYRFRLHVADMELANWGDVTCTNTEAE